MNKIGSLILIWVVISIAYVFIAATMPVIQDTSNNTATDLIATSNMTNYPGTLETVRAWPLLAWFVPGALGIGGTFYVLKSDNH